MTRTFKRLRAAAFAAGVGAALTFGATAARAEARPACDDPFANGSCTTTSQCAKYCRGVVGAGTGQCSGGCCYCIWF